MCIRDRVDRDQLLQAYKAFKTVVPGKAPEKQLDKAFEEASGFSTYQAVDEYKRQRWYRPRSNWKWQDTGT